MIVQGVTDVPTVGATPVVPSGLSIGSIAFAGGIIGLAVQ